MPFAFTGARLPPGFVVDHYCGTREMFRDGSGPASPPVAIGALGWPLCCHPPFAIFDQVIIGALSNYVVTISFGYGSTYGTAPVVPLNVPAQVTFPGGVTEGWWVLNIDPLRGQTVQRLAWSGAVGVAQVFTGDAAPVTIHGTIDATHTPVVVPVTGHHKLWIKWLPTGLPLFGRLKVIQ